MAAAGRELIIGIGMTLALALSGPALAQSNDQPIDVTVAPPPSADSVGPAQLRNFDLRGPGTRQTERQAAPTVNQPAPAPVLSPSAPRTDEPVAAPRPAATARSAEPARRTPDIAPSTSDSPAAALPTLPQADGTGVSAAPVASYIPEAPSLPGDPAGGGLPWAWIAALVALLAGGAYLFWSKQQRGGRYGDPGRLAFAGGQTFDLSGEKVAPEASPRPAPQPRPDPVPPRPDPVVRGPMPAPRPAPAPAPAPPDNGLIVSRALKPQLSAQMIPDRAIVTPTEVMIQFDVTVHNSGSAPARDVLIEAMLVTAHARQDEDIARFFAAPRGEGDRIAGIAPLGRINLKTSVRLPIDQVHRFEAGGRQLFVPLVAINLLYRSSGGADYQESASFLIGRGGDRDEKLAPFRIDIGPRIFRGLSVRPHSNGLSKAA